MKAALLVAILAVIAVCVLASDRLEARSKFDAFKRKFEKTYTGAEHEHRLRVFTDNLKRIEALNKMDTAVHAVNKFADLTAEEFARMYLSSAVPDVSALPRGQHLPTNDLPDSWDWTQKGAVTPVKNQGQCGSCWAFSTTGNVEGQWFLAGHPLTSLSEQQLVDCDRDEDQGCNGGLPSNAYQYIIQNGGLETEQTYPYEAIDDKCRFDKSKVAATISNWTAVPEDETQIASWLVNQGPLSIGINAEWMQFYSHGVSNPLICDAKKLDHGVLIVAYGTDGSTPFWKIKNSWGTGWGEGGYYRIVRGKGKCGLNTMVTTAMVSA